jgi:hypothetical protein
MMDRFRRLINDLSIKEVSLIRRKFTWSSSVLGSSTTLVKLDRVFCLVEWEDIFPNYLLQSAANDNFDHYPLILGLVDEHPGKKIFYFECFLPKFQGFQEAVQTAWNSIQPTRCPWRLSPSRSKLPRRVCRVGVIKKLGISGGS